MEYLVEQNIITKSGKVNTNYRHLLTDEIISYLVLKTPHLDSDSSPMERIFNIVNGINESKLCEECNAKIAFVRGYRKYCSTKCSNNNSKVKANKEKTWIDIYGVSNPNKSESIRNKIEQTCLDKYGTIVASKSKQVKDKTSETMIDRYGVTNHMKLDEFRSKSKNTMLDRYGVEYPLQSEEILSAMTVTMLDRYGVSHNSKTSAFKERIKQRSLEKNGTNHHLTSGTESQKLAFKIRKKNKIDVWLPKILQSFQDKYIPKFKLEEFIGIGKEYLFECLSCHTDFEDIFHASKNPRCPICEPTNISKAQADILEFISLHCDDEIITNDRKVIAPFELDIVIPSKQFALEYNGLYWHSESNGKNSTYHLNKTKLANKAGFKLIQIFEDEWINKPDIVKSRLLSYLGKSPQKIYARKCEIKKISAIDKNLFLEANHLQGKDSSSIRYGAFYESELIAVMTFGKSRFDKKIEWELIRYSSKKFTNVVGVASKILARFIKDYDPTSIISYADLRWSIGNLYTQLNFEWSHDSIPNHFYFKNNKVRESRQKYQKHKLYDVLENYQEELSANDNMKNNGYNKIWDCGNKVYILKLK